MDMELSSDEQAIINDAISDGQKAPKRSSATFSIILAIVLVIVLVMWYFPAQSTPIRPHDVPGAEIIPKTLSLERPTSNSIEDFVMISPEIKILAATIASRSCSKNDARCHAQSLYLFVRDTINYIPDPLDEYYETPHETLLALAADCDGQAILLRSLMEAVGIQTRFKRTPGHITVEAWLPRINLFAPDYSYEWVLYDPTCTTCRAT